jgi:hypothetical protein
MFCDGCQGPDGRLILATPVGHPLQSVKVKTQPPAYAAGEIERIFMKGIGLLLLFIGVGIIAYAFNASDSVNSAIASGIARILASLPGKVTTWLLIGGSGAVVVGMTMIFKRPVSSKS